MQNCICPDCRWVDLLKIGSENLFMSASFVHVGCDSIRRCVHLNFPIKTEICLIQSTPFSVILYIRVYAFSERNKRLLAFLVALFVVSTCWIIVPTPLKTPHHSSWPWYRWSIARLTHCSLCSLNPWNVRILRFFTTYFYTPSWRKHFWTDSEITDVQSPFPNFVCVAGHAESFWLGSVFSATLASVLGSFLPPTFLTINELTSLSWCSRNADHDLHCLSGLPRG